MRNLEVLIGFWIEEHPVLSKFMFLDYNCLLIKEDAHYPSRLYTSRPYSPFNTALYIDSTKVRTAFQFIKIKDESEYLDITDPEFFKLLERYLLNYIGYEAN